MRWEFVGVTEVHALHGVMDGAEVYSQIRETENADDYCRFVQDKAALLKNQVFSPKLQIA